MKIANFCQIGAILYKSNGARNIEKLYGQVNEGSTQINVHLWLHTDTLCIISCRELFTEVFIKGLLV